jgi:hypothetical protein
VIGKVYKNETSKFRRNKAEVYAPIPKRPAFTIDNKLVYPINRFIEYAIVA